MRRRMLTIVVAFVLAFVNAALAQTAGDEQLIVPGERIGRWSLNMRLPDLLSMARDEPLPFGPPNASPGLREVAWLGGSANGLYVGYRDAQIEYLGICSGSFKTAKGVGVGSAQEAVIAAYGQPNVQTSPLQIGVYCRSGSRMIFDSIGIAVDIQPTSGKVNSVEVFRPGKANEIWRF